MRPFFFYLAVLLLWLRLPAQGQYFNNRYPALSGTQSYLGPALAIDSGFVLSGSVNDIGPNQRRAQQLRFLTPDGQTRRLRQFAHPTISYYGPFLQGLVRATGGGYAMVGGALGPGISYALLWRFNALGDTLWKRNYRDPAVAQTPAHGMCRTLDGGYALVGVAVRRRPTGDQYQQAMLLRVDSAGTLLWRRYYGNQDETTTYFVTATPDGGFLLSGHARTPIYGRTSRTYLLKVDAAGNPLWQKLLGDSTVLNGIGPTLVTRDGHYLLAAAAGRPRVGGNARGRPVLYQFTPAGALRWQREIGPVRRSASQDAIFELPDGSFVGGGQWGREDSLGTNQVAFEAYAYKVCANGDSVWMRGYRRLNAPSSDNYLNSFCQTPNGGFLGTGYVFARPPDTGTSDGWAFRIDSMGYLVAGGAPPARVCPRPTVGLPGGATEAGAVSVYPNPSATGVFWLAGGGGAEAVVTDALGRVVRRQVVATGNGPAPLDLSAAPPGVYLLRLRRPDGRLSTFKLLR